MSNNPPPLGRRDFVRSAVAGTALFPAILADLLAAEGSSASITPEDPLAPKPPHFPARAKNVIFLFMSGGVSHVDSFDPKPRLAADHGKKIVLDHPETRNRPGYENLYLKRPQWEFAKHGASGTEVSTLFPNMAGVVDDLAVIRSMHADHSNHYNATLGMHTGSFNQARPSLGGVGELRAGDAEPKSAVVPGDRAAFAVRRGAGLGGGLPAGQPPGDAGDAGARADAEHPPADPRPTASARSWTPWPS